MSFDDPGVAPVPFFNISAADNIFEDKDVRIRAVVGSMCVLSIIGSVLILFSYVVEKERTKAREILAHISLMDFGVAISNLIGLSVYFDRYYSDGSQVATYIDYFCKIQAFFAEYCTLASIFWTTALAAYLFIVILYRHKPKYSVYFLRFCYFFCYGLAIGISAWLLGIKKLGYAPYDSSGWCSLVVKDPNTHKSDFFVLIFAYDLWIYLAIILIIVFYVAIRSYSSQLRKANKKWWSSIDFRFILIPVTFILLRMWTCIMGILTEYIGINEETVSEGVKTCFRILIFLGGIGDSGQGFVNAILFIVFSKATRKSLMRFLCHKCKKNKEEAEEAVLVMDEEEEPTTDDEEDGESLHIGTPGSQRFGSSEKGHNYQSINASTTMDVMH